MSNTDTYDLIQSFKFLKILPVLFFDANVVSLSMLHRYLSFLTIKNTNNKRNTISNKTNINTIKFLTVYIGFRGKNQMLAGLIAYTLIPK